MSVPPVSDIFDVVDREDRVIGRAPRAEVHARQLLHRAVHVLVHDDAGRLFLQKRSLGKDTFPGCWDSSCSGHVDTGETYEIAARRELSEELGFADATLPLRPIVKLAAAPETGHEFIQIYALGPTRGPFVLHPEEISDGRWIVPAELTVEIESAPEAYAGALRHLWRHHRGAVLAALGGDDGAH
jgi:isopentenyl-diphosphate delta-isomerase type 1